MRKPRKPSLRLFHSQELTGIMDRLQVSSCFLSNGHNSTLFTKTRAVEIPLSPGLESYAEFTRMEFKVFTYVQLVRTFFKGFILPSSGFDFCVFSLNIHLILKSHRLVGTELLLFGLTFWLFQIFVRDVFRLLKDRWRCIVWWSWFMMFSLEGHSSQQNKSNPFLRVIPSSDQNVNTVF